MSNLKEMNTALERVTTVKDIFTLDFVADRTIKNYQAVSGRKDGANWFHSETLALMQVFSDHPDYMKLDKMSIWGCLMTAARTGLSIAEGDFDLVPYGKILKADRNYKGMRKQLRTMPSIKAVGEAQVVWKGEAFKHDKLNNKILEHIAGEVPKEPTLANVVAGYVRIQFKDGSVADVVMYQYEIAAAKAKSKMKGPGSIWEQFETEMIKKTVIRRANKVYFQATNIQIPDDQFAKYEVVDDNEPDDPTPPQEEAQPEQPAPQPEAPVEQPAVEAKVKKKSNMDSLLEEVVFKINEYLEPGTYEDDKGSVVVVLDVVNHVWNDSVGLPDALPVPLVVVRNLDDLGVKGHSRCAYPIDVFKGKFKKI